MLCCEDDHKTIFNDLFLNEKYSDLTIRCRDGHIPVHRSIVCPQSTFLQTYCDSPTKLNGCSGMLALKDQKASIVEKCMSMFYIGNYEDAAFETPRRPSSVMTLTFAEIRHLMNTAGCRLYDEQTAGFARDALPGLVNDSRAFDSLKLNECLVKSMLEAQELYSLTTLLEFEKGRLLARERFLRAITHLIARAEASAEGSEYIYANIVTAFERLYSTSDQAWEHVGIRMSIGCFISVYMHSGLFWDLLRPLMNRCGVIATDVLQNIMMPNGSRTALGSESTEKRSAPTVDKKVEVFSHASPSVLRSALGNGTLPGHTQLSELIVPDPPQNIEPEKALVGLQGLKASRSRPVTRHDVVREGSAPRAGTVTNHAEFKFGMKATRILSNQTHVSNSADNTEAQIKRENREKVPRGEPATAATVPSHPSYYYPPPASSKRHHGHGGKTCTTSITTSASPAVCKRKTHEGAHGIADMPFPPSGNGSERPVAPPLRFHRRSQASKDHPDPANLTSRNGRGTGMATADISAPSSHWINKQDSTYTAGRRPRPPPIGPIQSPQKQKLKVAASSPPKQHTSYGFSPYEPIQAAKQNMLLRIVQNATNAKSDKSSAFASVPGPKTDKFGSGFLNVGSKPSIDCDGHHSYRVRGSRAEFDRRMEEDVARLGERRNPF